jgi:uncharacterized membrane protein YfcA
MYENEILFKILLMLFIIGSIGAWLVGYINSDQLIDIATFVASYIAGNMAGYRYGYKKGVLSVKKKK